MNIGEFQIGDVVSYHWNTKVHPVGVGFASLW